jgi:hypothetical protein
MAIQGSTDNTQLTNYLNNLGYENYVWKTKYNELWANYLSVLEENKRLQQELQNQTNLQSVETMLQNDAASGNRNPLIEFLQKKNAELISIILQKDAIIANLQKNIPNSPPPIFPTPPPVFPTMPSKN